MKKESMIVLKNVSKRYGPFQALHNISFSVEPGEVVGFLGPNGAGKTTTMQILTGYIPPTSGSVSVAGIDVLEDSRASRAQIGYLPELNPLYGTMDVRSFLLFVAKLVGVDSSERQQQVASIIEETGLEKVATKTIKHLSRGYKQRVGIAQALVGNPPVLILDEPTVGLDPNQIREVRDLIRRLGKEETRSVILSTHILKEVTEICDRVIIINEGKVVASDTPDRLSKDLVGTNRIHVRIQGDCEKAAEVLQAISGVSTVSRPMACSGVGEEGMYDFTVEAQDASEDLRSVVSKAVVQADLALVEVRIESIDLEEVFSKLTTSAP